jgi:Tol biopolymer transport system component
MNQPQPMNSLERRQTVRKIMLVTTAGALVVAALVTPALATFKGANGRLVYQGIVGEHEQLFTIRPDGTDVRQLTDFPDSDASKPVWSPDSTKITFFRRWGDNKQRLYRVNADGSGLRELDRVPRLAAAWFPDGKHLLVLRNLRWTIVTPTGSSPRPAGIPGEGDTPCIFPDGKHVAMTASLGRQDGKEAIFIGTVGGGQGSLKRITPWQSLADKIDCSPDGSRIVFSKPEFGPPRSSNVFVINADGSGLRQLTHSTGGKVNNGANSWSPDGHKISFISNRDGEYGVYTMNANGTGVKKLTKNAGDHYSAWGSQP